MSRCLSHKDISKTVLMGLMFLLLACMFHTGIKAEVHADEAYDAEILFSKAMQERREGNYQSSIDLFQSILNTQQNLHRARLELAVAYFYSEQHDKAIEEAEIVLDAPDTPPNVRVAVLTFISQVKSGAAQVSEKL